LIAGFVLPERSCAAEQLVHHTVSFEVWLPSAVLYAEEPMTCVVVPM
jgi:hypothetical protein